MAEVIGLSASIIAIVDLSAKLASHCKFYVENVQNARADFCKLLIEITSVGNAIDILQFLIDNDPDFESDQLSTLSGESGSIAGCLDALKQLEAMLPPPEDNVSSSSRLSMKSRMRDIATRLTWPSKKTRAMGLLDDIMKHKATIQLVMTGDISKDVKEVKTKVRVIQEQVTGEFISSASMVTT
ncbi:hypothetical protein HYQ45_010517 [Verticillium longisporum]|uniref:Fungal N-terminal domain-containing protein n=1 Tax=Verticillium longisporum TaxID=100787 RepID=A0A8I2ZJ80_VERLO|nr:hypothetical protein HYQ45_010517 [Verticillium longisporum]